MHQHSSLSIHIQLSMTPAPFTNLPLEVHLLILNHLSQHEITSYARVNKQCYSYCEPLLWKYINIHNSVKLQRSRQTEAQQAFLRNATHVSELHLIYMVVFDTIFGTPSTGARSALCTGLLKMELSHRDIQEGKRSTYTEFGENLFGDSMRILDTVEEDLLFLVQQNPKLQSLGIHTARRASPLLSLVTEHLPNLQRLDMSIRLGQNEAKLLLEHLPESIRTVRFRVLDNGGSPIDPAFVDRLALRSQRPILHHALESLCLDGRIEELEEYILLPFLHTCSSKLQLYQNRQAIHCFMNPAVHTALSQIRVTLTSLKSEDVPHTCDASDEDISEIICCSQDWKTIDLERLYEVSFLTASAIADNCDHLQEVVLAGCSGLRSVNLLAVLGAARNLRVFRAIHDNDMLYDLDPWLVATDMVGGEWATRSLEAFICKIEVPEPDDEAVKDAVRGDRERSTARYCLDVQRQVLRLLAVQTKLKTLRFGAFLSKRLYCPNGIMPGLEMTLESGLDQLAVLQDLEELSVCWIRHEIKEAELEWMSRNWPRLQSVRGVVHEGEGKNTRNALWIRVNRPRWVSDWEYRLAEGC